jgi:hypothetical protein
MPSSLLTVRKALGWTNLPSGFQMHFTKMELENQQDEHRNTEENTLFLFIPGLSFNPNKKHEESM